MASDSPQQYRVTRSGRDVFVGDGEALVAAAEEGRVRENDLIFDPATDTWVFARSHELLEDHDLEALVREYTPAVVDGGVEPDAEQRLRWSRVATAVVGTVLVIALAGVIAWLVAGGGEVEFMSFLSERAPAPTIVEVQPAEPAAEGTGEEPPPPTLPEDLVFDMEAGGGQLSASDVFEKPSDAQRRAYGLHEMKTAGAILDDSETQAGNERLRELLGAVARAEFAKVNMQQVSDKDGIAEAKAMIERVHEVFLSTCQRDHSERYCELKLKYPSWNDAIIAQIEAERVIVGMKSDHVFAAWGRPTRMRRVGGSQRYCYGQFCGRSVRLINRVVIEVDD